MGSVALSGIQKHFISVQYQGADIDKHSTIKENVQSNNLNQQQISDKKYNLFGSKKVNESASEKNNKHDGVKDDEHRDS